MEWVAPCSRLMMTIGSLAAEHGVAGNFDILVERRGLRRPFLERLDLRFIVARLKTRYYDVAFATELLRLLQNALEAYEPPRKAQTRRRKS
jgi:hypothetical protein